MAENRSKSDGFMLRLPDGMRERIKAAATENERSMNAEIIATLLDAYPPPVDLEDLVRKTRQVVRSVSERRSAYHVAELLNVLREADHELRKLDEARLDSPEDQDPDA